MSDKELTKKLHHLERKLLKIEIKKSKLSEEEGQLRNLMQRVQNKISQQEAKP
jgi:hypothetical protein